MKGNLKREWLPLLVTFNHDPQSYLHTSWWKVLPQGEEAEKLHGFEPARPHLNRYLRRCLDISRQPALDFGDRLRRLALLPPPDLWSLCSDVGVCRHARAIRKIITGEVRRRLETVIGRDRISLALQSGLGPSLPPEWENHSLPETEETLAVAGMELIMTRLGPLPEEIGSRLRLKFPASWSFPWPLEDQTRGQAHKTNGFLLHIIIGRLPQWQPLFA